MIWKAIMVFFLSTVKFALAFPLAYGAGLPFYWMFLSTTLGGISGILLFSNATEAVTAWMTRRRNRGKGKTRKKFTKLNKWIVRAKHGYGLWGIALLTPVLLSIPVGTIIATRYYRHKKLRVVLVLSSAVVFWSLLLSTFSGLVEMVVLQ